MKHTHSDRLERWLGAEKVAMISRNMRDWYGPPIAMADVPGMVFATRGGEFIGEIQGGQSGGAYDRFMDMAVRERKRRIAAVARCKKQLGTFGSINAIMAAASAGKYVDLKWNKTGASATAAGAAQDLFGRAGFPNAGAAAAAAPGGTNYTSASQGAIPFTNPATTNSYQPVSGSAWANVANNALLMYDRLSATAKTMNSTATEAVTNTPTRYQSAVSGNVDSSEGNFYYPYVPTTILPATAHNWTVCQYTNSAGTAGQSSPSIAGQASCVVGGIDLAVNSWFMPLAAGDLGVRKITQMQCSALVATGTIEFVMGHPLCYMSCPVASSLVLFDWVYTAFRAVKVLDNACISFLELPKPATTVTSYFGNVYMVAE